MTQDISITGLSITIHTTGCLMAVYNWDGMTHMSSIKVSRQSFSQYSLAVPTNSFSLLVSPADY